MTTPILGPETVFLEIVQADCPRDNVFVGKEDSSRIHRLLKNQIPRAKFQKSNAMASDELRTKFHEPNSKSQTPMVSWNLVLGICFLEVMHLVFPRMFAKIRRNPGRAAVGLFVILVLTGVAVGVRLADPWRWWGQKAPEESVYYHWEQANQASDNGDVALARTHLEAILAMCPLNTRARFLMARTCRRADDSTARQHLSLAESLGWPRDQIILEQRLTQAEAGDIWSVEKDLLDQLNRLPPEERVILEGLVKGYLNSARFVDAAEIATTWIKRFPRDWPAYLYRGRAYQGLGRWGEAVSDYQVALKIRPDSIPARLWLADTLLASHDYQYALDNYQTYSKMAPDDAEALFAIAECQFSLGRPEAAATLENLLAKYPKQLRGLILSAKINLVEGAADKALVRLQQAQAIAPHDLEILQALIAVLRQLNRQKEADQLQKEYSRFLEQGQELSRLREEIQSEPGDVSRRYQAGKLCLELGEEKEGFDWLQSVLFIDPDHRPAHLALADYWAKQGQPQRAAYHLRRAEGKRR
jgi:tetratricopeptide (TPR) repeat protein